MLVYKKKRQQVSKNRVYTTGKERTCGSIFLDSGAHTLFTEFWIKPERKGLNPGYSYYRSKRFKAYVDKYAEFVKAHLDVLDHYVTVDAIFEPRISWQVTKYLEREHGLSPVPVLHFGTPMKWVEKYLAGGYDYLGIGGLGQEVSKQMYYAWADRLFDRLCDNLDPRTGEPLTAAHRRHAQPCACRGDGRLHRGHTALQARASVLPDLLEHLARAGNAQGLARGNDGRHHGVNHGRHERAALAHNAVDQANDDVLATNRGCR